LDHLVTNDGLSPGSETGTVDRSAGVWRCREMRSGGRLLEEPGNSPRADYDPGSFRLMTTCKKGKDEVTVEVRVQSGVSVSPGGRSAAGWPLTWGLTRRSDTIPQPFRPACPARRGTARVGPPVAGDGQQRGYERLLAPLEPASGYGALEVPVLPSPEPVGPHVDRGGGKNKPVVRCNKERVGRFPGRGSNAASSAAAVLVDLAVMASQSPASDPLDPVTHRVRTPHIPDVHENCRWSCDASRFRERGLGRRGAATVAASRAVAYGAPGWQGSTNGPAGWWRRPWADRPYRPRVGRRAKPPAGSCASGRRRIDGRCVGQQPEKPRCEQRQVTGGMPVFERCPGARRSTLRPVPAASALPGGAQHRGADHGPPVTSPPQPVVVSTS